MKITKYYIATLILITLAFISCKDESMGIDYLPAPDNNLSGDTLKLMTYNVRAFINNPSYPDGNYEVIAEILKDIDPDVVCMQEIDSMTTRSKNTIQIKQVADLNFWNYRFMGTIDYQGGRYGIGVTSKRNIVNSSRHFLTSSDEKRAFLIVEFAKYIAISTHLDLNADFRKTQAQEITAKVKELYGNVNKPIFLSGDLNDTPTSETLKEFYKDWKLISTQANTFPAKGPTKCIDYILMLNRGYRYKILDSKVIGVSSYGNMAIESDHLPVLTTIIIP